MLKLFVSNCVSLKALGRFPLFGLILCIYCSNCPISKNHRNPNWGNMAAGCGLMCNLPCLIKYSKACDIEEWSVNLDSGYKI
jgi:hypothetical protein